MSIVTVSHEIGAGGPEIGQKVAERLGLHYVDQELISDAARRPMRWSASPRPFSGPRPRPVPSPGPAEPPRGLDIFHLGPCVGPAFLVLSGPLPCDSSARPWKR